MDRKGNPNFFFSLGRMLENIKEAPQRQKDSLRKLGAEECQHSPQATSFYTFDDKVVNILKIWANLKNPGSLKNQMLGYSSGWIIQKIRKQNMY